MNKSTRFHARLLRLAGSIALAYPPLMQAQIVAAPGANRPVVDNTANGRPLVQIVAPNGAGVSHNQYQQFNVERHGALLNNATGNALTQQGGWVGANPQLGGNAARLIVNEVTSANPSRLRGYLEVAGQRADVVVANPNGILVDGFGFLNASRGTLTTGTPVFGSGGSLDALRVTRGHIAIGGNGLNDQGTAQVDLIARSVQVNAALWADRLNVVTGANQVKHADLGVQLITGAGGVPTVAVDVAAVGGMYANRIRLIGTEHGVGVKSDGKMASAGDFQIDSAGRITLNADASAGGAMRLSTGDGIVNRARVSSGGTMELRAASVDNQGKELLSGGNLSISAGALNNTAGSIRSNRNAQLGVQSGFAHARGDTVAAAGDLAIVTAGDFANQSELAAGGKLSVQAANISNSKAGLLSAGQTTLLQAGQNVSNSGRIYGQDVAISAQSLRNDHDGVYGDSVPAGVIAARNSLNIGAATVDNREHALMKSDGDLAIGGALDAGNKAIGAAASVTNSSATIDAGGKLTIASAALRNTNAHFASEIRPDPAQTRRWTEYEIDGSPRIYTPEEIRLSAEGGLMKLIVRADGRRYNHYTIRNITQTSRRTVVTRTDPGKILARGDMLLTGGTVDNDKSVIVAGGTLTAHIDGARNGGSNPQGEIHVRRDIVSIHRTTKRCAAGTRRCNTDRISRPSVDLPVTHVDLGIWTAQAHTVPPGVVNPAAGRQPDIALLPPGQLYRPAIAPGAGYLIETDPAFVNFRAFLSSDYLLGRMTMNPQAAHKRLGDGYYEQQLVNEQILRLTGRTTLGAYASNEAQYKALMDAGVTFAQSFGIVPGVALSKAQMAQLTSDIVWLVEREVTLPDGGRQTALAPVVYLAHLRAQDIRPTGALIAADNIDLQLNDSLANAGTLRASGQLGVNAGQDIDNTLGTIASNPQGGNIALTAARDVVNQSGTISGNRVAILAGRDANIATLANASSGANGTQIALDRTGNINAGALTLQAQRDVNLNAASINTTGDATITAANNLNLNAVKTQNELNVRYDDRNHLYKKQEQANGSVIQSGGNATLTAGKDLNAQAAYVSSAKALTATAGRDLHIGAATQGSSYDQETYSASSGVLSSQSVYSRDRSASTQTIGSTLSGDTVTAQAGRDLTVTGSDVVSTLGTQLGAAGDIGIVASRNTAEQRYRKVEKTSGVYSGGGMGVTIGSRSLENEQTSEQLTHNVSTVGSTDGNVVIAAGQQYRQTGSNVLAPKGDIAIAARQVDIAAAIDRERNTQDTLFKQSGITLQITSPVISAIQTAQQMKQAAQSTSDARMRLLAAANIGFAANNAMDAIRTGQGQTIDGKANQIATGETGPDGKAVTRDVNDADKVGGINLAISLGASKSESHSESRAATARSSAVAAGGNVNIAAQGAGADSNLVVQGSDIKAGINATLKADNQVKLLAAQSTTEQHSSNKGVSGSIGVSMGTDGLMFNGGLSGSRGRGDGSETTQLNTRVDAGNKLAVSSGADTTLKGAVASGKQVMMDVGTSGNGNLNIESLQDSSTYKSNQQSLGVSISAGMGRVSGSLNASRSSVDGNYASVNEQSGIKAGDDGFQIKVAGNTDLKGGKIASTDKATAEGKNRLTTGTLTQSDIQNRSDYQAESQSIGIGAGYGGSELSMNGTGVGIGRSSGSQSSTTHSGISQGDIRITDGAAQQARTGMTAEQTLASLNTKVSSERDTSGKLVKNWDGQQLQNDVQAQAQITQMFGKEASKAIGDYATSQLNDLNRKIEKASPEEKAALIAERDKWAEGGLYRTALHTAAGALGGGIGGALGAATSSVAMPKIGELISGMNLPQAVKQGLAQVTATALGGLVGGASGLAAGVNVEANNRQLHKSEVEWIDKNKKGVAKVLSEKLERPVSEAEAAIYLTLAGEGNVDQNYQSANGNFLGLQTSEERQLYNAAKQYIAQNASESFTDDRGIQQKLFVAKGNDFNNGNVYSQFRNDKAYRDFYWNTMGANLKPDNPTAQELAIYQEREAARLSGVGKQLATGAIPAALAAITGKVIRHRGAVESSGSSSASKPPKSEAKPSTTSDQLQPEADFAGRIPVRKDLIEHLSEAKVSGKQISGGHNESNFMATLNSANGTVVSRTEIAPGIYEIKYQLPKGVDKPPETKTVYDPKIYNDTKMGDMAQEAAAKGMIQYQLGNGKKLPNGSVVVDVQVNGVNFNVPVNNGRVPSVFPGKKVE